MIGTFTLLLVAEVILHIEEIAPVVEELRDQELGAGFDLLGGEIPVLMFETALDVAFGIDRRRRCRFRSATDEADQIGRVRESAFRGLKARLVLSNTQRNQ